MEQRSNMLWFSAYQFVITSAKPRLVWIKQYFKNVLLYLVLCSA